MNVAGDVRLIVVQPHSQQIEDAGSQIAQQPTPEPKIDPQPIEVAKIEAWWDEIPGQKLAAMALELKGSVPPDCKSIFERISVKSDISRYKVYEQLAAKLTDLLRNLKKHAALPSPLPDAAVKAFYNLRACMCERPVLHMFNPALPCVVYSDASNVAMGAILNQVLPDGREVPVCYTSKKWTKAQANYDVRDRELLAATLALLGWHYYLKGRTFKLYTDHEILQFIQTMRTAQVPTGRVARWVENPYFQYFYRRRVFFSMRFWTSALT